MTHDHESWIRGFPRGADDRNLPIRPKFSTLAWESSKLGSMPTYNTTLQKARLADVPADAHGLISKRTAELDGVSVTEVTFNAGARWSNDLKAYAGTDLCELPHVALVTAGTLRVVLSDGSQEDFSAGDVMLLPPGHDAWSVGDQACTFVEFSKGNDYYS
jgi:hypothetical protein